ncbi:MAG: hypothetical protein NZM11_00080 [Anaerolineales bacterium]|nr:hypothetical protein [Anaerolineales bacterium]
MFFAPALSGYCFLTLQASEPIWRLISPLELVQFPWRMLGPAARGLPPAGWPASTWWTHTLVLPGREWPADVAVYVGMFDP